VAEGIMRKLADRLALTNIQVDALLLADPTARVVQWLVGWIRHHQLRQDNDSATVSCNIEQLAQRLGLDLAHVTTAFAALEAKSILRASGQSLQIASVRKLEQFENYLDVTATE
jgi:CRP-like cAMP-binding protein